MKYKLFLSLFGVGFIPHLGAVIATVATGVACLLLHALLPASVGQRLLIIVLLFVCIFFSALMSIPFVGSQRTYDHHWIVIDEFLGVLVAFSPFLIWQPSPMTPATFVLILLAFGFFDFFKPFGIRAIDRKEHWPAAVVIDDILAGVYAALLSYGVLFMLH
ncbi:hypothetical protein A3D11_01900 [Candidatus Peribacteria bacterium RIFCSPHIGHO2_02_FULL_49_16]|nr:MAG: hypothetical protein A2880_01010 [Candidatus Peribacteria bacterium RIFCSPHIGHO2_01_FULL_49_38]OGJ58669.1 MAG: hypothetical protein A3D11_01900 [Candidatus Peribacteria bacterium RIFCSPHIGHO2_02_FULL_49_16]